MYVGDKILWKFHGENETYARILKAHSHEVQSELLLSINAVFE